MAIPSTSSNPSSTDPVQAGQNPSATAVPNADGVGSVVEIGAEPAATPVQPAAPDTKAAEPVVPEAPVTPASETVQPAASGPVTVEPTANMIDLGEDVVDPNAALKDGNPQVVEGETNPEKIQKEEVLQKIATDTPVMTATTETLPPMPDTKEELHKTIASDNLIPPSEIDASSLEMKPEDTKKMEEQSKDGVAKTPGAADQAAKAGGSNFAFKMIILVLVLAILATIGFVAYTLLV